MSRNIMIEEATKAKLEIHAEMVALIGKPGTEERFADLADSLNYYNTLLVKLGAGPNS